MTRDDRCARRPRTASTAALLGLLACASCARAPRDGAADLGADAAPQAPAFSFRPADPEALYSDRDEAAPAAPEVDRDFFPRFENGEIRPPRRYDVEKRFSPKDARRMRGALAVAHRDADVNAAFADG
jgi:uncharacterized protein involved in copper resistance